MQVAVVIAGAWLFASWTSYGLLPESNNVLPTRFIAGISLASILLGILGFLTIAVLTVIRRWRDLRPFWIALLGTALGGMLLHVVQTHPDQYFGIAAGIFASLILALSAGWMAPHEEST